MPEIILLSGELFVVEQHHQWVHSNEDLHRRYLKLDIHKRHLLLILQYLWQKTPLSRQNRYVVTQPNFLLHRS